MSFGSNEPQFDWADKVTYERCSRNAAMVLMHASEKADTVYGSVLVDVANGWMRLAEIAAANPPLEVPFPGATKDQ